ncbi:MAG: hypothetical protein CM1200mP20_02070 [Pseudomonadota bacterium]|nr:MAG: hypothetical protein CM1200mP20_02070 [Pseudomonadota bacterium]
MERRDRQSSTGLTRNPWNLARTPGGPVAVLQHRLQPAWDLWLREVTAVVRFAFRQASAEFRAQTHPRYGALLSDAAQ